MALNWSSTRDSLTTALATAANCDRPAIIATRSNLEELGGRYDAAAASSAFAPVASTIAPPGAALAVAAERFTPARAALERAVRYLESLPGVSGGTPFDPSDTFATAADDAPVNACQNWRHVGPGVWDHDSEPSNARAHIRLVAALPGLDGNALSTRWSVDDGRPVVEAIYAGRVVGRAGLSTDVTGRRNVGPLLIIERSWYGEAPPPSGDFAMSGGTGGARAAVTLRAELAKTAAREILARVDGTSGAPTATARVVIELALERVEAAQAALSQGADASAAAPPAAVELALAEALDGARRLLSFPAFA